MAVQAQSLAARLSAHGYQVQFPADRDPAVFKLTGLPGDPDVEVSAGEDGSAVCHHRPQHGKGHRGHRPAADGLPAPAAASDAVIAAWTGIAVEWHYLASAGEPACAEQVAVVLLAHLAVLGGQPDGKDVTR
ncbi:MAG: hypothetical protein ACRDOI_13695 [Trebonia sp.]